MKAASAEMQSVSLENPCLPSTAASIPSGLNSLGQQRTNVMDQTTSLALSVEAMDSVESVIIRLIVVQDVYRQDKEG